MNNTYTELISFNQLNTRKMLVYLVYMHIYILKRNHFKNKRIVFQPSCLQGELWFRFWAYPVILDSRWGRNHCQRAMVLSLKWWKCVMFEGMQPYLGGWTTQITTWWQTCVKNDQMQTSSPKNILLVFQTNTLLRWSQLFGVQSWHPSSFSDWEALVKIFFKTTNP